MNKKFLLGAALLVGLGTTFTSCVDSVESASVTNIRNAKAEQLKSLADLNRALAEKELIIANAQKAAQAAEQAYYEAQAQKLAADSEYARAQAELLKAQAEYQKALAASVDAKTEADKARLEMELKEREMQLQLAQAELDKKQQELKQAQADLAAQQARLQAELDRLAQQLELLKIDVLSAQFNYDQMIKAAQEAEDEAAKKEAYLAALRLKKLYTEWEKAANDLVDAKATVAQKNAALIALESGLATAKETAQNQIVELTEKNQELAAKNAELQAAIDLLQEYAGKVPTLDEVEAAIEAAKTASAAYATAADEYETAAEALNTAKNELDFSDYMENVRKVLALSQGSYNVYNENLDNVDKDAENPYDSYSYQIVNFGKDDEMYRGHIIPENCRGTYALVVSVGYWGNSFQGDSQSSADFTFTPVFKAVETELDFIPGLNQNGHVEQTGEHWDLDINDWVPDYEWVTEYHFYYNLVDDGAGLQAWLKCRVADLEDQSVPKTELVAQKQKDLTAAKAYLKDANDSLANAKAKVVAKQGLLAKAEQATKDAEAKKKTAQDAWTKLNEALTDKSTDEEKAAVATAFEAYQNAKAAKATAEDLEFAASDAVDDANHEVEGAQDNYNFARAWVSAATTDLANAQKGSFDHSKQADEFTELVNSIIAESPNNEANIAAYNAAAEAEAEAENNDNVLETAANTARENASKLLRSYAYNMPVGAVETEPGETSPSDYIKSLNSKISNNKRAIEANDAFIKDYQATLDDATAEVTYEGQKKLYTEVKATLENDLAKAINSETAAQLLFNQVDQELKEALAQ